MTPLTGEKVRYLYLYCHFANELQATTRKEVIVCGGSIDTPRLLLLNGIGPKSELEELGIKVVKDLPGVGKQLRDHVMAFLSMEVDGSQNDRYSFETNANMLAEAKAMWEKDKSGTFALHHGVLWGGFLKLPGLEEHPEYQDLSKEWQEFLSKDTVPAYEFIGDCLLWPPGTQLAEGNTYMTAAAFLMNAMSEGSITLRSADPEDKPVIDLAYLEHPYDRRVMREALRETYKKLFENPEIKKDIKRQLFGPKSLSDSDIDEFLREAASTVWHMHGTAKMGKAGDTLACVDPSFRVYGIEGLRVADLSVCPLTPK